jgi:two-component system chemotaxis response regulator CheB/chemosensory pili system protein ChpB (putative protein-glutamate methylesterase)
VHEPVSVALIGRKDEARDQLQKSLTEFGASVVFEGEPPDVDLGELRRTAPGVVIVNLDAALEDALDSLQSVLDDPAVNVIFNEADVTRQLGGWDLARWARHLAAKVLGHVDTNPPMPADAEALPGTHYMPRPGAPPTPAEMAGERFIEEFTVEADDHADAIPTDYLPMEVLSKADTVHVGDHGLGIDFDAIEGAMSVSDAAAPQVAPASVPDSQHAAEDAPIDLGIDLSVLDAALSAPSHAAAAAAAATSSPATAADEAGLLESVLGEFNLDLDTPDGEADGGTPFSRFASEDEEYQPDDDVARLAAQLDGMDGTIDNGGAGGRDEAPDEFDFSVSADGDPEATPGRLGSDSLALDDMALDAMELDGEEIEADADADVGVDAGAAAAAASASVPVDAGGASAKAFDFGALELAPIDDEAGAPVAAARSAPAFDFGALDLSLEPMGDGEDAVEAVDVSGDAIQRVVVLGASIGGPDALRTFLAGIPPGFPALFVLAQHLDNGFFERLAQQLQKASRIPVRVAQAGEQAAHGQVLVVPSDVRMCIAPDGSIAGEAHAEAPRYRPCIDDVMRDIADRFGSRATAIVFSGMAGDAIEGSVYLTAKGGEVWAQTPESCVVSSMVDGASAKGVVEFFGTPRELADRCVARYGR